MCSLIVFNMYVNIQCGEHHVFMSQCRRLNEFGWNAKMVSIVLADDSNVENGNT